MTSGLPPSLPFDHPLSPKVDTSVGAKCHLFRPPPLSASSSLQNSTASLANTDDHSIDVRGKKRSRHDFQRNIQSFQSPPQHISHPSPPAVTTPTTDSPASLASTRYKLAPVRSVITISSTGIKDPRKDQLSPQFRSARRRGLDPDPLESPDPVDVATLETLPNDSCQSRLPKSPNIRDGVGNVIYRFAGVAGKVLQNWSSTFRGFYSGGGPGFDMRAMPLKEDEKSSQWDFGAQGSYWRDGGEIPATPGRFPQEDYIPNYWSQDLQDEAITPPRKRNKRDPDVITNWVMVSNTPRSKDPSPSRSVPRKAASSPASVRRANPRSKRPLPPMTQPSYAGSPRLRSDHASYASPRSVSPVRGSPVSAEVQKHAARIRRKEAEEDARLKVFNQQLKAMIREGKEALGTRFEVEEIDDNMTGYSDIFGKGSD